MNSLKGVNKQIIEINHTGSDYVQKAILIINPEKGRLADELIQRKAYDYMNSLSLPKQKSKAFPRKLAAGILLFLCGSGITLLISMLIK